MHVSAFSAALHFLASDHMIGAVCDVGLDKLATLTFHAMGVGER
jgi:hypothetical protein